MKRFAIFSGLMLLTAASGCMSDYKEELAECHFRWNTYWAADAAYHDLADACTGLGCPNSFKDGFRAGYMDIAEGGLGCPPAVPKFGCCNHMWLDHCSEGDKMAAWYDGWELGVIAARGDGMVDAYRMVTRIPQATPVDYPWANQKGTAIDAQQPDLLLNPNAVPPVPATPYAPPIESPQPSPDVNADPQSFYLPSR